MEQSSLLWFGIRSKFTNGIASEERAFLGRSSGGIGQRRAGVFCERRGECPELVIVQ